MIVLSILCAVVLVLPSTKIANAADTPIVMQLKTASFHAGELAQQGAVVATSLLHVQHVMNCLEGRNGKNFKAAAGYPCEGQGNGIIPDLTAAAGSDVKGAEAALRRAKIAWTLAQQALAMKDVNEVQPYAKVIAVYLKSAIDALQ
jgi:hypothetical protein